EPVWAIGTGKNATPEDADLIHSYIRDVLKKMYNEKISKDMIIQYGGSMKPENAEGLLKKENIDGGLIGGAGLKSETFLPIAMFGC
ncbi:triose-phosphate isomerase, partial [Treponema pedis]